MGPLLRTQILSTAALQSNNVSLLYIICTEVSFPVNRHTRETFHLISCGMRINVRADLYIKSSGYLSCHLTLWHLSSNLGTGRSYCWLSDITLKFCCHNIICDLWMKS